MSHFRPARGLSQRAGGDVGAYAILYALLVVVFIGFAAIVVDIGAVRQDRRLNRASADSAVIAAASQLSQVTGVNPRAACDKAWDYLLNNLPGLTKPASACSTYNQFQLGNVPYVDPAIYCGSGAEVRDTVAVGNRRITVAWPLPPASTFFQPDVAPGTAVQPFNTTFDGDNPCSRIGVAIAQDRTFGLGSGLGTGGVTTEVHSVARNVFNPGSGEAIAALNILNRTDCQSLEVSGQAQIVVNRTSSTAGGIISVESAGTTGCSGSKKVVSLSLTNSSKICASGPMQTPNPATTDPNSQCDGKGNILAYALDNSATADKSYPGVPADPAPNLRPKPSAAGGRFGWEPVTDVWGCKTLTPCPASKPQYIPQVFAAYSGDGTPGNGVAPTMPYMGDAAYAQPLETPPGTPPPGGAFQTLPGAAVPTFTCNGSTNVYVPAGNWFIDCPDPNGGSAGFDLVSGSIVVFGGGNIVFRGGVSVSSNTACLAINVPLTPAAAAALVCPPVVSATTDKATTSPRPQRDAQVFIRGVRGLTTGSSGTSIRLPQTFVYQMGAGPLDLGGGSTSILWTAPGAGALDSVGGPRRLDALCTPTGATAALPACLDSRFSRVAYWNESTTPSTFTGQAALSLTGVFFFPQAQVSFGGTTAYTGSAVAQFWADKLDLSGQSNLVLTPDPNFSVPRPFTTVALIR